MSSPLQPYFPYIASFIFFSAYSVLYKNNPIYKFTTNLVIGVAAGYAMASMIDTWYRQVYLGMWTTQGVFKPEYIWIWVLGALYFFIFVPRLISIYRAASIFTVTVGMGVSLPYGAATIWASTQSYAWNAFSGFFPAPGAAPVSSLVGAGRLVAAVAFGLALSYFFFTAVLDKPTAPFRKLGRVVLLTYTAMNIAMVSVGKISLTQWQVLNAIQGVPPTWFIPIGMFIIILIDHFIFPFNKLMPGKSAAKKET